VHVFVIASDPATTVRPIVFALLGVNRFGPGYLWRGRPPAPSCTVILHAAAMLPEQEGRTKDPDAGIRRDPERRASTMRDGGAGCGGMEKLSLRAEACLLRRRPGRPEPLRWNFGPRDAPAEHPRSRPHR